MNGRYYTADRLSPIVCPHCLELLPLGTANAGERTHPTCGEERGSRER